MHTFDLPGRVALITGGAGGIGLGIAERFARAGAKLVLADIAGDRAKAIAGQFRQRGVEAIALVGDVGDPARCESLVTDTLDAFGQLDILVNNAGYMGPTAPLQDITDEDWERVMRIDLGSVFRISRAAIPHMRERQSGSIISLASIAGKEGTPNLIPYSVAKAGIIALTKALAKEVIRDGIRVNCVAPAVVDTPLLEQLPKEAVDLMLSKAPMGRFGTVDEVAAVVHFLASDAAGFISAQCLDVSGGRATY
jgi:3-oxoacyl-[acyl-carrier protein] reductase